MREPTPHAPVFGILAEFGETERLLEGVEQSRKAGYRRMDAYTPFPVEGLAEALGFSDRRVPLLALAGGIFGAALGYGMQVYTNLAFPIDIGNRPLISNPAFMLIVFELTVLFAVLAAIFGMFALNRLPRLNHPVFGAQFFRLATRDKFFLIIFGDDERFDRDRTREFLEGLGSLRVEIVPHSEEPE
jgi:hypothetical protein